MRGLASNLFSTFFFPAMNNLSSSQTENNGSLLTPGSTEYAVDSDSTVALLSLVIFLALFGNGLVILAFYRFHVLRTVTNYFVVSLAVADIFVASLSMPFWMYFRYLPKIPKQDQFLKTLLYYSWQYMDILCSTASILNLCMISVDRHLAINSPLTYHSRMTAKRAKSSIFFAWLFAFFCATLSVVTVVNKIMPTAGRVYAIFIAFTAFFIPLLILVVVYSKICCIALRQVRQIRNVHSGITHGPQREHNVTFRHELRITKTLGIVVGAFVLCWGPFFSFVVVYAICPSCPDHLGWVDFSKWLHYANSTINPLIYMLFTRSFRSAFRRLLLRGLCCKWRGGTCLALSILKTGSIEPSEMLSATKTAGGIQRRITGIENSAVRKESLVKANPCHLSVAKGFSIQ